MKASQVAPRAPTVVERLEPKDFQDTWGNIPSGGVAVGLRRISDAAEGCANREAAVAASKRFADVDGPEGQNAAIIEYNNLAMATVVAYSLCDPNDVSKDPPCLKFPLESTRSALTSAAIRRLFDRYDRMRIEHGVLSPEATPEELRALAGIFLAGVPLSKKAKRLAHAILTEV